MAFFNCCFGCGQGVLDAELLFLHFGFGGSADLDYCYAAGELCESFLELLAVEVGGCGFDCGLDLSDMLALISSEEPAPPTMMVFSLLNLDLTCAAELCELGVLELKTEFVADDFAAGEDSDVAEHFLASVAKSRSLYRDAGEGAAELVENEGGESFAFDVLSDDEKLLALLDDLLKKREDLLDVRDLLVGDEDVERRRERLPSCRCR